MKVLFIVRWVNCIIYRAQFGSELHLKEELVLLSHTKWKVLQTSVGFLRDNISYPLTYDFSSNGWIKILYNIDSIGIDEIEFKQRSSKNEV
jgi:hypothetical protein